MTLSFNHSNFAFDVSFHRNWHTWDTDFNCPLSTREVSILASFFLFGGIGMERVDSAKCF